MSRSDNTSKKFDTHAHTWLELKLLAKQDEQSRPVSRATEKSIWRKEINRGKYVTH